MLALCKAMSLNLRGKMESDCDTLIRVARSLQQQRASRKRNSVSVDHLLLICSHLPPHKASSGLKKNTGALDSCAGTESSAQMD